MLKRTMILLFLGVALNTLTAQTVQISSYKTLSSLQSVRAVTVDGLSRVWTATSGGVFVFKDTTSEVLEFRNINALLSLDATSIFYDPVDSLIYVGGGNGSLDISNLSGEWSNITDISRSSVYQRRAIRGFAKRGDTLFIASDFGVVLFDTKQQVFIETIDRIGRLQEKTAVNGISLLNDSIWVATDSGLAVASLNVNTLRLPSVWRILDTANGLPAARVSHILNKDSEVIVASGQKVLLWTGLKFELLATASGPINGISYVQGKLHLSTIFGIVTPDGPLDIPWTNELQGHSAIVLNNSLVLIGFVKEHGIELWTDSKLTKVSVNSPISNQFSRIALDGDGGLWVATDVEPPRAGQGVSYFNGQSWSNFNSSNVPEIETRACYRVSGLPDGSVWIGTWGKGAVRATKNNGKIEFKLFNGSNSALQGITADPNYLLAADATQDRLGNTWIANEQASSNVMFKLKSDETSSGFPNCIDPGNTLFRSIAVDGAGNKWLGSIAGFGILAFNERNPDTQADDICNYVRSSNTQLPDNVVNILRIDKNGALWIGTPKGVAVISSPSQLSNTVVPFVRRISFLTTAVVNDIYVDALNYKWIATTTGVFVLNEDGTQVLLSLSKANAPLLDDNIRCVAVDDANGLAYLGTSFGCTVASTSSIKPVLAYSLSVRPQPFSPQADNEVTIDGLAADSDIRIMTTSGILVMAFQSRGRQAVWDGTDTQGRPVPPGVYLIHATSATAGTSAIVKCMVRR